MSLLEWLSHALQLVTLNWVNIFEVIKLAVLIITVAFIEQTDPHILLEPYFVLYSENTGTTIWMCHCCSSASGFTMRGSLMYVQGSGNT